MTAEEKRPKKLNEMVEFNLERHIIAFLQHSAFYAEISRNVRKLASVDIPTACVTYDAKRDEVQLIYNPIFFAGGPWSYIKLKDGKPEEVTVQYEKLSDSEVRGVLQHEFDHLVFGHLTHRFPKGREKRSAWRWATDLAINSMIVDQHNNNSSRDNFGRNENPLPKMCLIPGKRPWTAAALLDDMSEMERAYHEELCNIVEKLPPGQASEVYLNALIPEFKKLDDKYGSDSKCSRCGKPKNNSQGQRGGMPSDPSGDPQSGQGEGEEKCEDNDECTCGGSPSDTSEFGKFDDHDTWDNVPEEIREYVKAKVKTMIEKAVVKADQSRKWGNIPASMQEEIRRSVGTFVDWRAVLRQFVGSLVRGERSTSIKRINRRYPYVHPGVKKNFVARMLVAVDMSGSVDDDQLGEFYAELHALTRRITVDILPFDCHASVNEIFEWKKGTVPEFKRVKCGGTDFNAPTAIANDRDNRGKCDGLLILTDEESCAPKASRVKRGWVLSRGHKLNFVSDELQVHLNNSKVYTGAWR